MHCRIIERRHELSSLPRATVVSTRNMELLRSWGIDEELRARGDDAEILLWECESLAQAASGAAHWVGYPTREQSLVVSPTTPACAPQDHLEAVMLRHLRTGALLVRPDGVPVGLWRTDADAAAQLADAVRTVTGDHTAGVTDQRDVA